MPTDVELASDRASASSFNSTLAAAHIFEQASRSRQESLAAGIDEATEELGTIRLSGDASRLVPEPDQPSSEGASEYDREEYPEPLLGQDPPPAIPRTGTRGKAKVATEWYTPASLKKRMTGGIVSALLFLGTVFVMQQPAPEMSLPLWRHWLCQQMNIFGAILGGLKLWLVQSGRRG